MYKEQEKHSHIAVHHTSYVDASSDRRWCDDCAYGAEKRLAIIKITYTHSAVHTHICRIEFDIDAARL